MADQANPWLDDDPSKGETVVLHGVMTSPPPFTTVAPLVNPEWWQRFADGNWWAVFGVEQPEPFNVAIKVGERDGKATVTGLLLEAIPQDAELTTRLLRQELSVPRLLEALGVEVYAQRGERPATLLKRAQPTRPRRPGPRGWPPGHFKTVAETYSRNLKAHPRRPMKTTAEELGTSEATARRWVARARQLGFLDGADR